MAPDQRFLEYRRARFEASLPKQRLYSAHHFWAEQVDPDLWRVGLTKFGARILGEMVDNGYEVKPNAEVRAGEVIGWVEGFKAICDLICVVDGWFKGENPALINHLTLVNKDPHEGGWLYLVQGKPGADCIEVEDYAKVLDRIIAIH